MNSVAGAVSVRFERGFKIKSWYWEPRFVGITREEGDGKAYDNLVIVMPYRPNRYRIEQDVQNEPGRC